MRTKIKERWSGQDYAEMGSSEDEDMVFDKATRKGTAVEMAPLLGRVVSPAKTSISHYSKCTNCDILRTGYVGARLHSRDR